MIPNYSQEILERLIVVEGMDGAGTSTQGDRLVHALGRAGHRPVATAEPTGGPVGMLIRMILRGRMTGSRTQGETDQFLAHLFAADRHDHLHNPVDGIRGLIERGHTVVCTRYFFSSYAYNGRTADDFALVERLNAGFPLPGTVIFMQVPVEVSLERLRRREVLELYEKEDELRRVAANFDRILAPLGDRVLRFDCTRPVNEVSADIAAAVLPRLEAHRP